jgi:hypothetical protein
MKQSKLMSWAESLINILVGFGISLLAQMFFLPLLGVPIALHQNIVFALIMTAISLARSFILRRLFEALHIRRPLSPFMQAAIAERFRQIEVEGYDAAHDDAHALGELGCAGAAYAIAVASNGTNDRVPPFIWPWADEHWKTEGGVRRNWVKATALLIAEGERFDRMRKNKRSVA